MVRSLMAALVAAGLAVLPATAGQSGAYPDGFRAFRHVKTTVVGKTSPIFEREGGIHHFYANPAAVEGYRSGAFPDGAVLVDELLEASEDGGVTREGPRRRTAVMVKDAARFAETGGRRARRLLRLPRQGEGRRLHDARRLTTPSPS
jgi:hypothetical protein